MVSEQWNIHTENAKIGVFVQTIIIGCFSEDFKYLVKGWKEGQFEQHSRPGSTTNTKVCSHAKVDKDSQIRILHLSE